jgi:hypothetical protein
LAIQTDAGTQYNDGVTGNGNTGGNLVFVIPANAPDQLHYQCLAHSVMRGPILIVN